MAFATLSQLPPRDIFGGKIRGRYVHLERLTAGEVTLAAGTVVPIHRHPHEQVTYVLSGRFEFTVGDRTTVLEPGMAAIIPCDTPHGGTTLTDCLLLDVFSPVREDYRD